MEDSLHTAAKSGWPHGVLELRRQSPRRPVKLTTMRTVRQPKPEILQQQPPCPRRLSATDAVGKILQMPSKSATAPTRWLSLSLSVSLSLSLECHTRTGRSANPIRPCIPKQYILRPSSSCLGASSMPKYIYIYILPGHMGP